MFVNVIIISVSDIEQCRNPLKIFMSSGIFFQSPAILVVSFYAIIISFQAMFFAFNRNTKSQCCNIIKKFLKTFFIVLKFVRCKIKFFPFLFCFQKLVIATLFYISINFLCALRVASFSRRESINPKFCYSIFAYPPIDFYFFLYY